MKTILLILLVLLSSLIARDKPTILPMPNPTQQAVDNINFVEGRLLKQQVYQERYELQQENIKKRNEYLKKQEALKKQKRIDANADARKQNEAYYESLKTDTNDEDTQNNSLIIQTVKIPTH